MVYRFKYNGRSEIKELHDDTAAQKYAMEFSGGQNLAFIERQFQSQIKSLRSIWLCWDSGFNRWGFKHIN